MAFKTIDTKDINVGDIFIYHPDPTRRFRIEEITPVVVMLQELRPNGTLKSDPFPYEISSLRNAFKLKYPVGIPLPSGVEFIIRPLIEAGSSHEILSLLVELEI